MFYNMKIKTQSRNLAEMKLKLFHLRDDLLAKPLQRLNTLWKVRLSDVARDAVFIWYLSISRPRSHWSKIFNKAILKARIQVKLKKRY